VILAVYPLSQTVASTKDFDDTNNDKENNEKFEEF